MQTRKKRPSKTKGGWVYVGESKRRNGKKMHYVGSTTRDVKTREREHRREVKKPASSTWVGKGSSYKTIGSFWSKNPRSDERKVKAMSRTERMKLISRKKPKRRHSKKKQSRRRSTNKGKSTSKSTRKYASKRKSKSPIKSYRRTPRVRSGINRKPPQRRRSAHRRR